MEMWEGLDHETQERIAAAIVEAIANNYGRVEIVVQRGMVTEVNLEKSWRRGLPSVQPKGSGGA